MCKQNQNILLSVSTLCLGGILYVFLREESWIARQVPVNTFLTDIRRCLAGRSLGFFRYYVPDFLWGLSLGCALVAVCKPDKEKIWTYGLISFGCGCVWELFQLTGVIHGTGDVWDVVMYFLAAVFCIIFNKRRA